MVHGRTMRLLLCLLMPVMFGITAFAQAPSDPNAPDFEPLYRLTQKKGKFQLVEKFSKIIETNSKIVEARDFDADVISVSPVEVNRLRVQALKPGVTTVNILDENNEVYTVEVFVTGDVRHLQAYLSQLFPSSSVDAVEVQESVVLRGWVTSARAHYRNDGNRGAILSARPQSNEGGWSSAGDAESQSDGSSTNESSPNGLQLCLLGRRIPSW